MQLSEWKHIVISRTDNLGDVVLSLPVAGYLKKLYPHLKILFVGKSYTRPIIEACRYVDEFIDKDELLVSKKISGDAILFLYPDKEIAKGIEAIPNPVVTFTNIIIGYEYEKGTATVVDMAGRTLQQFDITGRIVPVDLSRYPEGIYVININFK